MSQSWKLLPKFWVFIEFSAGPHTIHNCHLIILCQCSFWVTAIHSKTKHQQWHSKLDNKREYSGINTKFRVYIGSENVLLSPLLHCIIEQPKDPLVSAVPDNFDKASCLEIWIDVKGLVISWVCLLTISADSRCETLDIWPAEGQSKLWDCTHSSSED